MQFTMQCRLHVHDASRLPAAGQQDIDIDISRGGKPLTPRTGMTGLAVAVAVAIAFAAPSVSVVL